MDNSGPTGGTTKTGTDTKEPWGTTRTPLTVDNVDDAFAYHASAADQTPGGQQVRGALVTAAKLILTNVPPSPDQTVAIRKLREAWMDCDSAISLGGRF